MSAATPNDFHRNRILSGLDPHDINLLRPHLTEVTLSFRQRLETPNRPIEHVYFIEDGLVSIIATTRPGPRQAEVGLVGFEGMTGLAVVTGAEQSPNDTVMQSDGRAQVISAAVLRDLLDRSSSMLKRLMLYSFLFQVQTAQTVLANAEGSIEERLARWLLMAHDRLESDELKLTHETLALMLGVRRPGVTIALQRLEARNLILTRRGSVVINDRPGMIAIAQGFYGTPEAEYERLFG